jgi:hypothetical protein
LTAAETPGTILVGGTEGERAQLVECLKRNRLEVHGEAANLEEALPLVLTHPEANVVLILPEDLGKAEAWVRERKANGFQGRLGVVIEPARVPPLIGKGRWNDFVLKTPVAEPDLCGAIRSSSRLSDKG